MSLYVFKLLVLDMLYAHIHIHVCGCAYLNFNFLFKKLNNSLLDTYIICTYL